MKHLKITISVALVGAAVASGLALADEDEGRLLREWRESRLDVAPVTDDAYREECGACHFAFQPGLLPARSWERIFAGLSEHFGDDASLEPDVTRALADYATSHAADRAGFKRSRRISASLHGDAAPLRVTETRYFRQKHHELPRRVVEDNAEVGSFSNCTACHQRAETGSYDEDEVRIAGYGYWDD